MKTPLAFALVACFGFSGCYTQLYTRGYGDRAAEGAGGYARNPQASADTALPGDSAGLARSGETGARSGETGVDTLYRPAPVIVNNYYHDSPYYRGYLIDDWSHPYISLGFYSTRHRDYHGAYWWHDPYYHRHHSGYHDGRGYGDYNRGGGTVPPSGGGGGNAGSYQSDKRIFTIVPDRSGTKKGRRSDNGGAADPAPAPKYSNVGGSGSSSASGNDSQSSTGVSPSTSGGSSSSENSSSSSSGSASSGTSEKEDHPKVNKGRRR